MAREGKKEWGGREGKRERKYKKNEIIPNATTRENHCYYLSINVSR